MWNPKRLEHLQPNTYMRRSSTFVDRHFQLKYSQRSFWIATISSCIVTLPLIYILNQNYSLLRDLAYDVAPSLLKHLEREQFFLNLILVATFIGHLVFIKIFSTKMSAKIVGPLKKMRNHLRLLSRGEYSAPPLKVRDDDEFQDLVQSFNYFYSGLQEQTQRELLRLLESRKLSKHPILSDHLDHMIEEKTMQLNLQSGTSEESELSAGPHRAS